MDESTFETFEEELCPSGQQELPVKPVRQLHRPDPQPLRKTREEPPRPGQREGSRKASLHDAVSLQSLTHVEAPWEWITLNRCLVLAIAMVLIGSSFQRLCEVLGGFGQKAETQSLAFQSVDLRHISLELDGQLDQIESSLWDNWFWNLILDDDATEDDEDSEEEEEEEEDESSRRKAEQTGNQEGLGGYKHRKSSKKNFLIERKKMRGRLEKTARWEKSEELSEMMRENKVREKRVRMRRSEENEDLGEDEEESPRGKRQSAEAERRQKRKKQLLQVKKVPIRGHRHNL